MSEPIGVKFQRLVENSVKQGFYKRLNVRHVVSVVSISYGRAQSLLQIVDRLFSWIPAFIANLCPLSSIALMLFYCNCQLLF